MSRRRKAREVAIQLLFKDDFNLERKLDPTFVVSRLNHEQPIIDFCTDLLKGVRDHATEIDEALSKILDNWKLGRLAIADRNIIRLGAYEIMFTDTPGPVIINECVEIAKRYGNEHSHQFVNGILDKLLQSRK